MPVSIPIARLNALQPAVNILTVYQTHVFAKLHKQNENWLCLKFYWASIEALKRTRPTWNDSSFQVLCAIGDLPFGKFGRCIFESCSAGSFDLICGTNEQTNEQTSCQTNQPNKIKTRKVQFIKKAGCRASKQDYCFDYSIYFQKPLIRLRQSMAWVTFTLNI